MQDAVVRGSEGHMGELEDMVSTFAELTCGWMCPSEII